MALKVDKQEFVPLDNFILYLLELYNNCENCKMEIKYINKFKIKRSYHRIGSLFLRNINLYNLILDTIENSGYLKIEHNFLKLQCIASEEIIQLYSPKETTIIKSKNIFIKLSTKMLLKLEENKNLYTCTCCRYKN